MHVGFQSVSLYNVQPFKPPSPWPHVGQGLRRNDITTYLEWWTYCQIKIEFFNRKYRLKSV